MNSEDRQFAVELRAELNQLRIEIQSLKNYITKSEDPAGNETMLNVPKIAIVIRETAKHFDLRHQMLRLQTKDRHISWPRQVAMSLAYELTGCSLKVIAEEFNRKCHATVVHANKAVQDRMDTEPKERESVASLRRKILMVVNGRQMQKEAA